MDKTLRGIRTHLARAYLVYSISLGIAVLDPWEKNLFHGLLLLLLSCASYTTYIFLPSHLSMLARSLHACFHYHNPNYPHPNYTTANNTFLGSHLNHFGAHNNTIF